MFSISQWQASLTRHWIAAFMAFVGVIAITVLVILYAPRKYRSASRLLLRVGHESAALDPTVTVTGDANAPLQTREDEVETAIDVMHSRTILENVVEQLGEDVILEAKLPKSGEGDVDEEGPGMIKRLVGSVMAALGNIDPISPRERAIRELESSLDISGSEKSSLVTVGYKSEDPRVSQVIVSAWVDAFLTHHAKVNRTEGTYEFFISQDAELQEHLNNAHLQIREAKSQGGFATLEGQQKLLEAQLDTVRAELLKVEADLVEAAARAESYEDLLTSVVDRTMTEETSGIASQAHSEMRSLLFQLEVLENEYAAKYTGSHPKLAAIQDQLAKARKIVEAQKSERQELKETVNPTHQQVFENRVIDIALEKSLQQRKKTLEQQKVQLMAEINAMNQHEESLARLTRNVDVLEERHKLHSVMLEQARLEKVLEENRITSISVVQPASLQERPVSPSKALCAVVGLLSAFVFALGIPVLLDWKELVPRDSDQVVAGSPVDDFTGEGTPKSRVGSPPASPASPVFDGGSSTSVGSEPVVRVVSQPR